MTMKKNKAKLTLVLQVVHNKTQLPPT